MKHRLARSRPRVDHQTVIAQALACSHVGQKVEHPLRLVGRKRADVVEAVDVPLGDDEQVRLRLRVDVADGDEAVRGGDVVAFAVQAAEEAILRQRGSPPR